MQIVKVEELVACATELADLIETEDYEPDSFTTQPIRRALKAIKLAQPKSDIATEVEVPQNTAIIKTAPAEKDGIMPGEDSPEWETYLQAIEAYGKVSEAYLKAREARDKAWEAHQRAVEDFDKVMEALERAVEALGNAREAYKKKNIEGELKPWSC